MVTRSIGVGALALGCLLLAGGAQAQEKIKVGVTATLEGTYTVLGEDGIRGMQTAIKKYGTKVGGKELEFIIASTDATPDSAVRAVRKLIEQDKVQLMISPLSGDEGIAVKNFAKTHPEITFINGGSGAQETTYVDPAPNFYRFNMDGAQWQAAQTTSLHPSMPSCSRWAKKAKSTRSTALTQRPANWPGRQSRFSFHFRPRQNRRRCQPRGTNC